VRGSIRARGASLCLFLVLVSAPAAAHASAPREAEALYRRALQAEARDGVESRRTAMLALERATLLAPDSVRYQLELARLYLRMGFLGMARHRFETATRIDSNLAEAHLGQGKVWRRDWLKYHEPTSLTRSVRELEIASRLAPERPEPWLDLVPLLVEQGRLAPAARAADRALAADGRSAECQLAIAHTAYRLGDVSRADSVFRLAIPRLSKVARERFLDIAPLASEQDTATLRRLPPAGKQAFLTRFWREHDPDLASPENEAQLEYWSRVTQAYFLFFNAHREEWDQRGEVYVRYGPPEKAMYNPVGQSLTFQMGRYGTFPMNVLVWSYPGLGMTVPMQDRLLSEYYLPPVSLTHSTDPAPDPDSLAHRTGSLSTAGGRGVFPLLPPGTQSLPIQAVAARFQGDRGPRLLDWVETHGGPGDSLWAEWVVLDTARAEVARVKRVLTASACDVSTLRAADFAVELPPGEYLAGVSVRGAHGLRGIQRGAVKIEPPTPDLELSDLVVSCGTPLTERDANGTPSLRLAANPAARVIGAEPLTAYFEAYHLATDKNGLARLEFEYVVRSGERDPRIWLQRLVAPRPKIPAISTHREEEQAGSIRRQVVSVPVQSLPPGRYRLEIRVRDLLAGTQATRSAEFVKVGPDGS
jgi:GWxTD domain-containing protein